MPTVAELSDRALAQRDQVQVLSRQDAIERLRAGSRRRGVGRAVRRVAPNLGDAVSRSGRRAQGRELRNGTALRRFDTWRIQNGFRSSAFQTLSTVAPTRRMRTNLRTKADGIMADKAVVLQQARLDRQARRTTSSSRPGRSAPRR